MNPLRQTIVDGLGAKERTNFLAILFRIAQVDSVSSVERDRLQPVADWMKASDSDLEDAMKYAYDGTVTLKELVTGLRGAERGLLLFRECCAVAWVDCSKSEEEAHFLDELASLLGLSDDSREILDSPLACSPEGERRFLVLLGGS